MSLFTSPAGLRNYDGNNTLLQTMTEGRFGCINKTSLNASSASLSLQTPYTWISWRCNKCAMPTGIVPPQSHAMNQSVRKLGIAPASKPRYAVVSFLDQNFRDSRTGNSPVPNIALSSGISHASSSRWTREGSSPSR